MFILQLPNLPFRALLAALLLAPMLNGAAVSAKEEATDPRSLLTTVQIEKILDEPFRSPERTTAPAAYRGQPSGTECDYNTQKGPTRKVVFIAYLDPSVAQAKDTFDRLSLWFAPKSKLGGIGNSAYIDDNHAIHVLKGKVRCYINIIPMGTVTPEKENS